MDDQDTTCDEFAPETYRLTLTTPEEKREITKHVTPGLDDAAKNWIAIGLLQRMTDSITKQEPAK